jgi:geranylgeranyl diphosphate synthase type II
MALRGCGAKFYKQRYQWTLEDRNKVRLKGAREVKRGLEEIRSLINEDLERYVSLKDPLPNKLGESVRYTLVGGGKRVRPALCFIVGDLFGVGRERLIRTACAVEMIHTASLIMDDLPHMDDSRTRRGRPANHRVYGPDVALLASIALLTRAFEVITEDSRLSPEKRVCVISTLANAVGTRGMVGGQFLDLNPPSGGLSDDSVLEDIHLRKTGSLFVASALAAAVIGDADEKALQAIETYAASVGIAFQIVDDLLDGTRYGEEAEKGARRLAREHTKSALEAVGIFGEKGAGLVAFAQMLLTRNA